MTLKELEQRVATLEQEVGELKSLFTSKRNKDWRRTIGMFKDDPIFDEIVKAGREWRKRENKRDLQ